MTKSKNKNFDLRSSTLQTCTSLKSFWILVYYWVKNNVGYSAYFFFWFWAFPKHATGHVCRVGRDPTLLPEPGNRLYKGDGGDEGGEGGDKVQGGALGSLHLQTDPD